MEILFEVLPRRLTSFGCIRDEAMRQTKKLHAEINAEREKVKSLIR